MKRHLDLYRALLLELEERAPPGVYAHQLEIEGYDDQHVREHLKLLMGADFVEGNYSEDGVGMVSAAYARRITHEGHDFLADIRSDTVWARTRERIQQMTGTASIAVIRKVAVQMAEQMYDKL